MTSPAFIICFLLLFVFGIYLGFTLGQAAGKKAVTAADYWKQNGIAVAVTVVASFALAGAPLLYGVVIGLLAGFIVGCKMAFGESVGPWRKHDEVFNVNRAHREAAERGGGDERRRRRKQGEQGPDLISTEDGGSRIGAHAPNGSAGRGARTSNGSAGRGARTAGDSAASSEHTKDMR